MGSMSDSNRTTANDDAIVQLANSAGTEIGTASVPVRIDPTGTTTQPVSASSLPLPSGASTASLQTTGNSSLSSIDSKTPSLGQQLASASQPVVLTAAQITTLTPLTSVTVTQATGTNLHTTVDNFPATQAISAVSLPLPTGAATSANQVTANASLSSIDAGIPAALGQTTMSASMPVTIASNQTAIPVSISTTNVIASWSSKLRVVEMNASSGGVARLTAITTTWTDVFSYSGSGYLAGFVLNVETFLLWNFRLLIDGEEILGDATNGLQSDDISDDTVFDLDDVTDTNQGDLGLTEGVHEKLIFKAPLSIPIKYNSSVVIKLKRTSGGTKKFQAGIVMLSKET